jgi:hypothetical protein
VLTNFPLATTIVTGVWLTIERNHPDGQTTSYTRELKDLIGPDVRQFGGQPELPPRGAEPLLGQGDVAQLQVIPQSQMPASELTRLQADNLAITPDIAQAMLAIQQIDGDDPDQNLDLRVPTFCNSRGGTDVDVRDDGGLVPGCHQRPRISAKRRSPAGQILPPRTQIAFIKSASSF